MISVGIIEGDNQYRMTLADLLVASGECAVAGAWEDTDTAMEEIAILLPSIVLVGIDLLGAEGMECILGLKKMDIPVLVLTVQEDDQQILNVFKAGALGYILKADTPDMILRGIKELNNGGTLINWKVARKIVNFFYGSSLGNNYHKLTSREEEVIRLLAEGRLYKEIACELDIALSTVKKHVGHIYVKMEVQNKVEAINKWRSRY